MQHFPKSVSDGLQRAVDKINENRQPLLIAAGVTAAAGVALAVRRRSANRIPSSGPYTSDTLPAGAYDCVIVGAGPSGSTAAYYMSQGGAKVALLEKEHFPRDKYCGDAVCTPAINILTEMGVMQELMEKNEAHFADAGGFVSPAGLSYIGVSVEKLGTAAACAVKRINLDKRMAMAATRQGAELREGFEVTEAELDRERGLYRVVSADGHKVEGRILIIADGATSKLAMKMGYCTEPPRGICSRAFVEGGTHNTDYDGVCFYQRESLPGYSAIFRHPNDELNFCYYLIPCGKEGWCGDVQEKDLKRLHEGAIKNDPFISKSLGPNAKIERMKAASLRLGGQGLLTTHDDHLIIVGDAAGHIDPLTGEGIHTAIMGGKAAGQAVLSMRQTGDFSKLSTRQYERRWMELFGHDFVLSRKGAALIYKYPILLDACANEMQRKGDAMMAKWAEVMTCMRPKSYFLRPDVAVSLGFAVVREFWNQHVVGRPDLYKAGEAPGCLLHPCSTLDPVLRLEQKGINPTGLALVFAVLLYLTATPGVLAGAADYYILSRWQRLQDKNVFTKDDLKLGKKLATGGFGTVYRAVLDDGSPEGRQVIVKKAKEFGEAEVWMNERLMRVAPRSVAEFITAFEEQRPETKRRKSAAPEPLWLVWQYEGDYTLWDLMQKKDFPYNMEPLLLGGELDLPKGPRRKALTIQLVLQQVLEALKACHATGIVHRDIKPQNVIISAKAGRAKLIDLGAAADLRVGINYIPNEFLLDPRYAPPQQYIMSTSTPSAPPLPLAATLSPILWRLNSPDRFDMYSVGMLFLQMAFPPLRSDNNLVAFNRKLQGYNYDLSRWRQAQQRRGSKDLQEGFQVLAQNGGTGWDLLTKLVVFEPGKRLSARAALRHPWFGSGLLGSVAQALDRVGSSMGDVGGEWLSDAMSKSGTERVGGLTEAQISEELEGDFAGEMPANLRNASNTIAWWRSRQALLDFKMKQKQAKLKKGFNKGINKMQMSARNTIRESRNPFMQIFGGGRTQG